MVRAILYVELAEDFPEAADQLAHVSLANCLQLAAPLSYNEVVLRVECNDAASLHQAITQSFATIPGVRRITTCVVINS
jgi:hypothetical protein